MILLRSDLRFSYDAAGSVVAVDYSTDGGSTFTTYYYLRNAQNDIVKLIDSSGTTVVEYIYDSWGKLLSVTGTLANTVGADQPFRYRGYVYDTETQWYYLQSRYYDPNTGRFISADVLLSTGQGVIGHNSFAYCGNNPIVRSDPSGCSWWDDLCEWVCDTTKEAVQWFDNNVVAPAVSAVQDFFDDYDVAYSSGYSVNVSPGIFTFHALGCVTFDTKGNIAIQGAIYGGMSIAGEPSASFTKNYAVAFVPELSDLNRDFAQSGGSYGFPAGYIPITAGGDVVFILYDEGTLYGFATSGGIGGSSGLELHGECGRTGTIEESRINIFAVYNWIHNKIQEW